MNTNKMVKKMVIFRQVQGFFLLFLAVSFLGCENYDYVRNPDGLIYRIIQTGDGNFVKPKDFLKIHQSLEVGDSIFYSTFGKIPSYGLFDSMQSASHDFLDILHLMRVGDSAIVIRSVDTLVKKGTLQYNELFRKGGSIKVNIKVLNIFPNQEQMEKDRTEVFETHKQMEIKELKDWIDGQNIKEIRGPFRGVFIKTEKPGNGVKIDTAMEVTVNYTGSLLNGKVFDSNVDSLFEHSGPFKFVVGSRSVIEGWDIALLEMKVGEKAKIYIPSHLAYGINGSGPVIKPFSHLIFEIEVLNANLAKKMGD
jgi:FKBP-type peptidyl-prolyl cis-trans isomerase